MNTFFFGFIIFSKAFREYIRIEKQGYKNETNESNERKYLKNMRNNQFLRVKNSLLELKKILRN